MAEIRQILSTPAVVNENNSDVHMSQQEQETNEQEVTITAILEEINKSSSSKSNNSIREERGVSRVVKAGFNCLTRVSNVEPFAYEDE